MIVSQDLHVSFNLGTPAENHVLRGLNIAIPTGQFVCVIGSNGAGKSTMLNAISGDLFVDAGHISIDGQDVTSMPVWERATLVSRVFQDPMAGTCESLTIEENMALAMARGKRRSFEYAANNQARDLFKEKLALLGLGLENRLHDRMGLLSGGQRQAISLLMASLQPSKLLLLDEHTAALDPKTASFVLDLTKRIIEDNKLTTMMVTHSMRQALEYGTRTVMLDQGRVVLDLNGEERQKLGISGLLNMFEKVRGEEIDDDALLLS